MPTEFLNLLLLFIFPSLKLKLYDGRNHRFLYLLLLSPVLNTDFELLSTWSVFVAWKNKVIGQVSLNFIFNVLCDSELNKQYRGQQQQTQNTFLCYVFPLGIGGPNGRTSIIKKSSIFWLPKEAHGHSVFPNPRSLLLHYFNTWVVQYFKMEVYSALLLLLLYICFPCCWTYLTEH